MNINKLFLLTVTIFMLLLSACGLKSDVTPKSSLDLPYPENIDYAVNSEGVSIYNGSDNYTLYVEKVEESIGFVNLSGFKRVALINPKQIYVDTDVVNNRVYKYRFRHFHGRIKTYSPAVVRIIKYYSPIKHNIIKVSYENSKICVYLGLSDTVSTTQIAVNGSSLGTAKNGLKTCYGNIPELSSTLVVTAIPYDKDNNTGIPYRTTIERSASKLNLPPQNVEVRRKGKDIVITWDKSNDKTKYNVYVVKNGKSLLYKQVDVELVRYTASTDDCINFQIASVRNGKESKKITLTACK